MLRKTGRSRGDGGLDTGKTEESCFTRCADVRSRLNRWASFIEYRRRSWINVSAHSRSLLDGCFFKLLSEVTFRQYQDRFVVWSACWVLHLDSRIMSNLCNFFKTSTHFLQSSAYIAYADECAFVFLPISYILIQNFLSFSPIFSEFCGLRISRILIRFMLILPYLHFKESWEDCWTSAQTLPTICWMTRTKRDEYRIHCKKGRSNYLKDFSGSRTLRPLMVWMQPETKNRVRKDARTFASSPLRLASLQQGLSACPGKRWTLFFSSMCTAF